MPPFVVVIVVLYTVRRFGVDIVMMQIIVCAVNRFIRQEAKLQLHWMTANSDLDNSGDLLRIEWSAT